MRQRLFRGSMRAWGRAVVVAAAMFAAGCASVGRIDEPRAVQPIAAPVAAAVPDAVSANAPPPAVAAAAPTVTVAPVPPAAVASAPPDVVSSTPGTAARSKVPTDAPGTAVARPAGRTAVAPPPAPVASRPAAKEAAPAVAAGPAAPALDLKSLEARLRETTAVGVMTKLTLKNQIDDLLDRFRAFYQGKLKTTLVELRRSYDLLVLKVLALLQDADPPLARAIAASREAIWGILADPARFATI